MLTNSNQSFYNSCTIETGLSDSRKIVPTVLKIYFQKKKARVFNYRDYGNFCNEEFRQQVLKIRYPKWGYNFLRILFKHLSTSS